MINPEWEKLGPENNFVFMSQDPAAYKTINIGKNNIMTDVELQLALAKMLPKKIQIKQGGYMFDWCDEKDWTVQETEWLHVCHLIEQKLTGDQADEYEENLISIADGNEYLWHTTWQQRAEALIKTLNDKE